MHDKPFYINILFMLINKMLSSLPVIWYIDDTRQWRSMDSFSCLKNKQMDTWLSGKLIAPGNVAKTDQWHLCSAFVFLRFLLFGCFRFSLVFQWFWCLVALSLILGCINAIWIIIDTSLIKWLNSWLSCDQTLHVLFVVTGLYCFPQLVTFIKSHYNLIHGAKSCRFFFYSWLCKMPEKRWRKAKCWWTETLQ